ncbi:MAG: hypothetical protein E7471_00545 [Ruminococcaceae bacterium]|nr:hypothetical protein [Oscillospiraceae bacterium]
MDRAMIEQLIKKKMTKRDVFIQSGIVFLTVLFVLIFCLSGLILVMIPVFLGGLIAAGVLFVRMNVEYEYTLLEQDLTVDRIRNRSGRRLVVWADVKTFDVFGPISHPQMEEWKKRVQNVHDARGDTETNDGWFAVFPNQKGGGKNLLLFQPNEKMLQGLLKQVSKTVVLKEDGHNA